MGLITTIEQLKDTVKVNKSLPFQSISPYLDDAEEKYMKHYLGENLCEKLTAEVILSTSEYGMLLIKARKALGPLALALATHELSIIIGDSGHTVTRTDQVTAASDNKVALSAESMLSRGWNNLERMLKYLEINEDKLPEWKECDYYKTRGGCYLNSAQEFQDLGKVDIGYSRLTFESFRPLIMQLEVKLRRKITPALDDKLKKQLHNPKPGIEANLIEYIRIWEASEIASLHTSQTGKLQRSQPGLSEFKPTIRPLYKDLSETGNFYAEQSGLMFEAIDEILKAHAEELGLTIVAPLVFNSNDKKIFIA